MKLAVILLLWGAKGHAQNTETMWRARGIEAASNLKGLDKKNLSPKELCQKEIETAYAIFANSKIDSVTSDTAPDGKERSSFGLIVKNESGRTAALNLAYLDGVPWMVVPQMFEASDKTRKGWSFVIITGRPSGSFVLSNQKCTYHFWTKDWLHPDIEVSK